MHYEQKLDKYHIYDQWSEFWWLKLTYAWLMNKRPMHMQWFDGLKVINMQTQEQAWDGKRYRSHMIIFSIKSL